jgi:hypothetical protein
MRSDFPIVLCWSLGLSIVAMRVDTGRPQVHCSFLIDNEAQTNTNRLNCHVFRPRSLKVIPLLIRSDRQFHFTSIHIHPSFMSESDPALPNPNLHPYFDLLPILRILTGPQDDRPPHSRH